MSTCTGRLLRVDLTRQHTSVETIPAWMNEQYISARGMGARLLYDELTAKTDPLGPDNKLIFLMGILGVTGLQGFSKWAVMAKSPLTNTIMRSYAGGNFGPWMKFAGYDVMVLEGCASDWTYLLIDDRDVHFKDARELMGLDPRSVQLSLKTVHGAKTESACIGEAGEKGLRFAVITSGERTASRGGVGTVMGAKKLKAVAINTGVRKFDAHDPSGFTDLVKAQVRMLKSHPRRHAMNTVGTPYITTQLMKTGVLPVHNFRQGRIETIENIDGDAYFKMKTARAGCYQCMTRCGGMRPVTRGPWAGTAIDGPEYETIFAFGPLLSLTDKKFIIDANALCDYYGMDTISTGVCVAFACELFEKQILTMADTEGLELHWGHRPALFELIHRMGRRQGLGRLLGEGVQRAAAELGYAATQCAMHIKGLELPGYEPRAVKGYALSMATANIGGSHMYGRPRPELSGIEDPLSEKDKGASIAGFQKEQAIEDSLIACTFGNSGLNMEKYARFLEAATGLSALGSSEALTTIGERIVCLERCFNVREGFDRKDDALPRRMTSEPLRNAGPASGQVVADLDGLLDEYYKALGYTPAGVPSATRLELLGLEFAQSDMPVL
ncbi:MAG: aldehyde ferredoxin oxidoreductase family protein [Desulfobacteraceae bacterium]|nr:aldehyde ferredoxin oxidoreductase family protein [Desulfobacteraceae bacterium]